MEHETWLFRTFSANQGYANNRCSGYALAPVLMDMDGDRWRSLMGNDSNGWGCWIYDRLVECQDGLLEQCGGQSASIGFVRSPANIYNGTCMILPSAIVSCCKAWGYGVRLYYYGSDTGIFGRDILEEECTRLAGLACKVAGYEDLERHVSPYKYLVALTRFKHWVSLKKTSEGYFLYGPAPQEFRGGMFGPDGFSGLLPVEYSRQYGRNFDGLVIAISPLA